MNMKRPTNLVVAMRGKSVENTHVIHAAVVDAAGNLLFSLGNPNRFTLARSAIKPIQALAILETPGIDACGFSDEDIALMCASHNSEEVHINQVRQILAKGGVEERHLQCGGHTPLLDRVQRTWIRSNFEPTPICSNCSGKHAGMLSAARAMGVDPATYHQPTHPLQTRIMQTVLECSGLDSTEDIGWEIDGCNLPSPALPLASLARTYANLANAASKPSELGSAAPELWPRKRQDTLARIFTSMSQHPYMVAGEDRFCTDLMRAFGGSVVGKLGADGCYGISVRGKGTGHNGGSLGIAVKVEDGDLVALYAAVMELLEQLDVGTVETRAKMARFHHPERLNTVGVAVGRYETSALRVEPAIVANGVDQE